MKNEVDHKVNYEVTYGAKCRGNKRVDREMNHELNSGAKSEVNIEATLQVSYLSYLSR